MSFKISTALEIHGYTIIEDIGVVQGVVVRTPTIAQGFLGAVKSIIGGSIASYSGMCETTRMEAVDSMRASAIKAGADAVVGFRYSTSAIVGQVNGTEVVAYGTAVKLERKR